MIPTDVQPCVLAGRIMPLGDSGRVSAIDKRPVSGPWGIGAHGLVNDAQANTAIPVALNQVLPLSRHRCPVGVSIAPRACPAHGFNPLPQLATCHSRTCVKSRYAAGELPLSSATDLFRAFEPLEHHLDASGILFIGLGYVLL